MWPFKKKNLKEALRDVNEALRIAAYERDRKTLTERVQALRNTQIEQDRAVDEEFGRVNSRLHEVEGRLEQQKTHLLATQKRVKKIEDQLGTDSRGGDVIASLSDQHTEFRKETLTALGVLRTKYREEEEKIAVLQGQIGIVREVSIGDLIDGGTIQECPDLEEYYDSELEFLRDIQHAHQYRPALRVVIGLDPALNAPCEVQFTSSGHPIKELDSKYCLRLDGRIGYSNDVDTESQPDERHE